MKFLPFDLDTENMRETLRCFPEQVRDALRIGNSAPLLQYDAPPSHCAFFGMGGSAIGADLLRSYLYALGEPLNMTVHRSYTAPPFLTEKSLAIAGSYSGNTEETLAAFAVARKITKQLYVQSSGGTLTAQAQQADIPIIELPGGYQPRAALGYSFFPLLQVFLRSAMLSPENAATTRNALDELLPLLDQRSTLYNSFTDDNPAYAIAQALHGSFPVLYSSDILEAVNVRWRGQIQENAKQLAFGNIVPEMNHNEINAWSEPRDLLGRTVIVFLRDKAEHERIAIRFEAMEEILRTKPFAIISLEGVGEHLLTRMFDLIYMADWVSYYLALLNRADPTAIPAINRLKNYLAGA